MKCDSIDAVKVVSESGLVVVVKIRRVKELRFRLWLVGVLCWLLTKVLPGGRVEMEETDGKD